jgi:hypothetical protein
MFDLLQLISSIQVPKINPDRNYWLVRTNAGNYYEDFLNNSYIALS